MRRPRALLALTDGPRPAWLFTRSGEVFRLHVPAVECVNAIGAGDVCAAIFMHELVAAARRLPGLPPAAFDHVADTTGQFPPAAEPAWTDAAVDAFAWGLAAACARCMHELPSSSQRPDVEAMRAKIRVERV